MTQPTLNIMEILQSSPTKATAGQLGLLEPNGQTDGLNQEIQDQTFDMIFGSMLAGASQVIVGQNENVLQNSLAQENSVLPQLFSQEMNQPGLETQGNAKQFDALIPQNMPLLQNNIKDMILQEGKELENGQFKVLSKEIVDSKLSLTIEGTNGKQLSISLPVESLQNSNGNSMLERVTVQDSYYRKELESLIEKVDIKQIEIKAVDTKLSQTALKPVEISIVGEQNAAVVTFKASLKKNQIKINSAQSTASNQKAAVLDDSGVFDDQAVVNRNGSQKLIEKVTLNSNQQLGNSTQKVNQELQLKNMSTNQSIERTDTSLYNYKTDIIENGSAKETMQTVRMQLPENIKSVLQPNSQAVVIKMNPEHLGPAKLSLSFSGGKLRAQLMVTSLNAKQVLDGSLDRLVDQLQKADIIVDKINVTLDGNQNQDKQFSHQQQWQKKMSFKNIDLNEFNQNEKEQTVQRPTAVGIQPSLSGSVNYLA